MVDSVKNIDRYSNMLPVELRMFVDDSPKDDLDWGLVMYLFENTRKGNIITLGKMSKFFAIDEKLLFERLDRMSWWARQYLNSEGNGKMYYTYEISEMASDFIVKLIELFEKMTRIKNDYK